MQARVLNTEQESPCQAVFTPIWGQDRSRESQGGTLGDLPDFRAEVAEIESSCRNQLYPSSAYKGALMKQPPSPDLDPPPRGDGN